MIDAGLVAIALVVAPLVFIVVGLVSRNANTPKRVLHSMGLLLLVGLGVGLLSPVLGAAAGFGVGIALTLNLPDIPGQMRRRMIGVGFALAYMTLMLFVLTPAGVLAGAVVPGLMVGFADEYGAWAHARTAGS
ncbi:MAG TPA: hypothetical protein VK969_13820 [Acidimicrobiia bacterium]|nr:hypothetical protein [Acidimicrobiia bacterium]